MRRLVLATGIATFVLIIVGGVVRVSDSGLGCGPAGSGFHGWPFCNGDVVPGVDLNSIVEYTHRVLAIVVGLMLLAIFVMAWRRHREYLLPAAGLLLLVIAQGALGGATVEENLEEAYVAAHLCLAMLAHDARLVAEHSARLVDVERLSLGEPLLDVHERDVAVVAARELLRAGRADVARSDDGDLAAALHRRELVAPSLHQTRTPSLSMIASATSLVPTAVGSSRVGFMS